MKLQVLRDPDSGLRTPDFFTISWSAEEEVDDDGESCMKISGSPASSRSSG
ncbi:Hypothetical predicted protein [Xyrichtys novacula]|uniref:Uncharacterized protein n=1 Tax=Xyrichtys novacula TaxID=13765 RepID=A0AAV1FRQ7_XYRNO|nr:Hypothetical predicted protein [Xyrichtys novacula]